MMFIHFRNKRDWAQFQSIKNLVLSISIEDTEILEHFQWTTEDKDIPLDKREAMAEEKGQARGYGRRKGRYP